MKKTIFSTIGLVSILVGCTSTTDIAKTQGESFARAKETPEKTTERQAQMYSEYSQMLNNPCLVYSGDKRDVCNFCTKMRQQGNLHDLVTVNGKDGDCLSVDLYPDLNKLTVPENCADFNTEIAPVMAKFDDLTKTIDSISAEDLEKVTDAQCKKWNIEEMDNFVVFGANINDMIPVQKNTLERMVELCSETGARKRTAFTQLPKINKTIPEKRQAEWATTIRECDMAGGTCRTLTDRMKKVGEACYAVSPEAIKAQQDAVIAQIDRDYDAMFFILKMACVETYPYGSAQQCECYAKTSIDLVKELIRKPAKSEIQAASQQAEIEQKAATKCKLTKPQINQNRGGLVELN